MFSKTIHNHLLIRSLVASCALGTLGAAACGDLPDAPGGSGETGGFQLDAGASEGSGQNEGGDAGQEGGSDEVGGEAGSFEYAEPEFTTGAETAGPEPLPDPEEPTLVCRVVGTAEIIGACEDDSPLHPDCDSLFAHACANEGGELGEPDEADPQEVDDAYCSYETDMLANCDAVFKNACDTAGGTFSCYWWDGSQCNDGECDLTPIPQ